MKRVVIVQARMTSTRLPGKVLTDVSGQPMLAHQIRRLRAMRAVDEIMIATTALATDDPVAALGARESLRVFRGDEQDVLGRYLGAARESQADLIVRITADCPLIDPEIADRVVRALTEDPTEADYASNVAPRTYPQGLDCEAFFRDALERSARLGRSQMAREHVTWFIARERSELFLHRNIADVEDNSHLRWTVDTADDLALIRRIYEELGLADVVRPYREILRHVKANQALRELNSHVVQRHL